MALELFDKAKQTVAEKVALMEKAGVKVTNVSIKRVGIDSATINTAIDINHPYCLYLNLPIHEISYRVRSGGSVIAHGTIPNPVSLKANSKTGINVPITVPYNFPASIPRGMGKDRHIDYECEIGVVIQIPIFGRFTLPVTKKGTVKMPTWSEIYQEAVGGT